MHLEFPYCYITAENNLKFITALHIPSAIAYWAIIPIIPILFTQLVLKQCSTPLKALDATKLWGISFILNLISGVTGVIWLALCPIQNVAASSAATLSHTISLDFFRSTFLGGIGTWLLAICCQLIVSKSFRKKDSCLRLVVYEDIFLLGIILIHRIIQHYGYNPTYPFEFYSYQLNTNLPNLIAGFLPYLILVFTKSLIPIQFQLAIALPVVKRIMSNDKETTKDFLKYRNDKHLILLSLNILLTVCHILIGPLAHYAMLEGLALCCCIVQFWYLRQTYRLCRLLHMHFWQTYTTLICTIICTGLIISIDLANLIT